MSVLNRQSHSHLIDYDLANIYHLIPNLPETADKLLVANVTIAINIVVTHQGLELDLLWEDSI